MRKHGPSIVFSVPLRNPITKVRIAQALSKARTALGSVADIAHVVNDMGPKPGLRNYAALGIVTLSKLVQATEFDPHCDPRFVWPEVDWSLVAAMRCLYARVPNTRRIVSDNTNYQITDLGGMLVVFQFAGKDENLWVVSDSETSDDAMLMQMGREIWKLLGTRIELSCEPSSDGEGSGRASIRAWLPSEIHKSDQTRRLLARARSFLDAGHSRAIMLHGQPGVGKSCMVQAIADSLSVPTMLLDQRQAASLSYNAMHCSLVMLRPEVVIIDDLDRIPDSGRLLGMIDRIRQVAKLLLVTVNDKDGLDPAVTRAGRFDDMIEVASVRSAADIIPQADADLLKELQDWPVAFVEELRVRLDVLGYDRLEEELDSLRDRVKANQRSKKD